MKLNRIFAALSIAATVLVSCEQRSQDEYDPTLQTPQLEASVAGVSFSAEGGTTTLELKSSQDWIVSGIPDWLTVSPDSGDGSDFGQEVTLIAGRNVSDAREAVITFTADDLTCGVKVKQAKTDGLDNAKRPIYFESFQDGKGAFTIKDVKLTDPIKKVWEHSSEYKCMKATAYLAGSNYESESWLISPEIDLSAHSAAYFTFEHAGLYFGNITQEATVWISKDGDNWNQLEVANDNYPSSWTFVSAGNWDLSEYVGGKMRIAFKFMSTATKSGTWEIRNVAVHAGVPEDTSIPDIDPTKTAWLELPATDDENFQYFAHRYKMDDEIHRNYSFAWSQKDLVSVWVAYPLCMKYMQKIVERTDAWAYDPHLGKSLSSAPFSYYAGDYERGHQLPSADRLCCLTANKQTFYGTNIIPQLPSHNKGVWGALENYIRNDIASYCDTLYVVTGGVVDGATEFSTDSDGKTITVPTAFFKALLRYKKNSDPEWSAAGFYTVHQGNGGTSVKSISMSVDELEEKIGFNLFVNLENKIGKDNADAIEMKDPKTVDIWNL